MMTLKDLFDVLWTIIEVDITAREPDGAFIHEWIYGPNIKETTHQYYDRIDGKLSIVDVKINAHGDPTRGGSEIGWGVKEKLFPKELIEAPVTHLNVISRSKGKEIHADVEMQRLTAEVLINDPHM